MIEVIRVATTDQIEKTAQLAAEIWKEHYTEIIGGNQVDYMIDRFQSCEAITAQIDAGELVYFLLCLDRSHVVFVEVRLRSNGRFGGAAESITAAKQRRVLIAAQWWLGGAGRRFRDAPCRFDAVLLDALDPARVTWLPGAFDAG